MKQIALEERACDGCGGSALDEIWNYSFLARTRSGHYRWQVRNVVCRACGFAFVSPAPSEASLREYYSDTNCIFAGQQIDYSISKRLSIIEDCLRHTAGNTYLEIGSNECPEFLDRLSNCCGRIETVEVNESCTRTYDSLDQVPEAHADIIASYFVLEHVSRPQEFLTRCRHALKPSGRLIIEVPNLHGYPTDPSGLFPYEHVNHFSPRSLAQVASRCGLALCEVSHTKCSRGFGFVAVFRQSERQPDDKATLCDIEPTLARACLAEGVEAIEQFRDRMRAARRAIDQAEQRKEGNTIVWGANTICAMLLEDYALPASALVVDSDPRRANFLSSVKAVEPAQAVDRLAQAELLVVNTRRHAGAIREWITTHTGRRFNNDEVLIVDLI